MPNYAIHDGVTVSNVIVCDSRKLAQELTGMQVIETTGTPWTGWTMAEDGWRSPSPFPSWVWDGSEWQAPIAYPSDGADYKWDEDQGAWIKCFPPAPKSAPFEE